MPERLVLRELNANDSVDADAAPEIVSVGESSLDSGISAVVGVDGTVSLRFPSEPARPREIKLRRRLRLALSGGDGGVAGTDTLGRRDSARVSIESIDQRERPDTGSSSNVTGGSKTELDARGDETDGASDTSEGLCETLWVEETLMGEAGTFASSARVRSCGEDVEVESPRAGRGRLESLSMTLRASILLLRTGGCAMTVPSVLRRSSSNWTRTPLRLALSDSRSSRRDRVEEIDGKVP